MAGSLMMYTNSTTWHGGLDSPNHGCPRAQPVSGGPLTSREVHPDLQIHHVTAALQRVRSKEDFMGLPSHPKIMRTSKHHLMACLLEVEPMLDIVRADIDLHIREVLVQRPHAAVIGSCIIQTCQHRNQQLRAVHQQLLASYSKEPQADHADMHPPNFL